jgi:DNA-binding protein
MELQEIKQSENKADEDSFLVRDEPVMKNALDVITKISSNNRIVLKADGEFIPNAVAVANIVTENMLKGNSSIQDIRLDSVISDEDGQMTSNIQITILKD